jgi:hypothetical protein
MRKLISCTAVALMAVLATSSTAFADYIPIGTVSFTTDGEQQPGRLILTNQTGDNVQDPEFPVEDFVSFLGIFLTTDPAAELNPGDELTDTNFLGGNYEFSSLDYGFGTFPRSVLIGGSVGNQLVSLSTGGSWNIGGPVFMCVINAPPCTDNGGVGDNLVQPFGTVMQGGELGIIYVEATPVPEPLTFSLLGVGVAGVLIRRRRAARG